MRKTSRNVITIGLLAGLLAGCGENDSASPEAGAGSAPPAGEAMDHAAFGEPGTGFIMLGDLHHDLSVRHCVNMSGALAGNAVSVDEPDNVKVSFSFSPSNWRERPAAGWEETGTVRVDSKNPYFQWLSGLSAVSDYNLGDIDPASLDITALEIAETARNARGEARFLDVGAAMQGNTSTIVGSFAFTCPEQ